MPAIFNTNTFHFTHLFFLLTFLSVGSTHVSQRDVYNEDLYLKPLVDGKLFAHFQFKTLYRKDVKSLRWEDKIEILPLSIVDLVATTDLNKLHFSLTKGNWNYKSWGYPVRSSPPGAQIRAKFSQYNENLDRSWKRLTNSLAGKFCASLISADERSVVSTKLAFGQHQVITNSTDHVNAEHILYSNLPEETLCTENLTPWKKLLPCYTNLGLATLLNAVNLLGSSFSSLALDLEPVQCSDNNGDIITGCEQVQLTQSISVVFNPLLEFEGKQTWSLAKMFGNSVQRECPLSSSSLIHVDITKLNDLQKLYPQNFEQYQLKKGPGSTPNKYATFNLKTSNLGIKQTQIFKRPPVSSQVPVTLRTHIAGLPGVLDGVLVATITNLLNEPIRVTYMDVIPHFLRVYLHTLTIRTKSGQELKPDKLNYVLSRDVRPLLIELSLILPANSETQIAYDFERAFLKWTDFKPDANKGVLLGSAMVGIPLQSALDYLVMPLCLPHGKIRSGDAGNGTELELVAPEDEMLRVYARPLLVVLPTPDFSMPYNVLDMVISVLAVAFALTLNIITKNTDIRFRRTQRKI